MGIVSKKMNVWNGGNGMIENFSVRKELFENTQYETLHFELMLDGKEYQGYYKDGEVSWFQMQPNQESHEMRIEDLEAEVQRRIGRLSEQ